MNPKAQQQKALSCCFFQLQHSIAQASASVQRKLVAITKKIDSSLHNPVTVSVAEQQTHHYLSHQQEGLMGEKVWVFPSIVATT